MDCWFEQVGCSASVAGTRLTYCAFDRHRVCNHQATEHPIKLSKCPITPAEYIRIFAVACSFIIFSCAGDDYRW